MLRVALLSLVVLPLLPAPSSKYDRLPVQQKIDYIENGKVPPGTVLSFPERDVNSFLVKKAKEKVPEGLRDPKVVIRDGSAVGHAYVDFVKMRHAQGTDMNWLMRKLLEGEHPISISGKLTSANGMAKVDLDRVEIGGNSIRGRALDLLIRTFVNPLYPSAKVGENFELGYNMDRIELKQGVAHVLMAPKKSK
jgi:hypothetical protein